MTQQPARTILEAASQPRLPRHIKLREDKTRGIWTILAPERVFTPDPIAVAVLQLCDGTRDITQISADLARAYEADAGQIMSDILPMLQDLADKGVVVA